MKWITLGPEMPSTEMSAPPPPGSLRSDILAAKVETALNVTRNQSSCYIKPFCYQEEGLLLLLEGEKIPLLRLT